MAFCECGYGARVSRFVSRAIVSDIMDSLAVLACGQVDVLAGNSAKQRQDDFVVFVPAGKRAM